MSRLDYCHPQIVSALEKEGWTVAPVPLNIRTPTRVGYIDIQASRNINGTTQQIMLAEVKCFPDRSRTAELYHAVGQYVIYRATLAELNVTAPLYLAVPFDVYETIFDSTARRAVSDNKIKLLIVNLDTETIVQWIE
jgi:hypothetical protein